MFYGMNRTMKIDESETAMNMHSIQYTNHFQIRKKKHTKQM